MKRRILFIALLVLAIGALAWLALRPGEPVDDPVYEGKTLDSWLETYYSTLWTDASNTVERAPAEKAIRQIGTNAIPTLLRLLRAKDSPFKLEMMDLFAKQKLIESPFVPAANKNLEAAFGFSILGPQARNAVPDLINIFNENISDFSRLEAVGALGAIGPDAKPAVPTLLAYVTNTNSEASMKAFTLLALGQIHSEPEAVLPVMLDGLKDTNLFVQRSAGIGIEYFGSNARPAVPGLVDLLKNPDPRVSTRAEQVLKTIDPGAADKAGVQ